MLWSCSGHNVSDHATILNESAFPVLSKMGYQSHLYGAIVGEHISLTSGSSLDEYMIAVRWKKMVRLGDQFHVAGRIEDAWTHDSLPCQLFLGRVLEVERHFSTEVEGIEIDSAMSSKPNGDFELSFNAQNKTRLYIALTGWRTLEFCFDKVGR